jgi:hypothetical protein
MEIKSELHANCVGCPRNVDGLCNTYREPIKQWTSGRHCPFHPTTRTQVLEKYRNSSAFIDPLKASKRKAAGTKTK